MLTKKEVMERYAVIRKFTAQYSGLDIITIEDCLKEIVASHNEVLELYFIVLDQFAKTQNAKKK